MEAKVKADIALCNFCYRESAKELCDWILDEIEIIHSEIERGSDIRDVISEKYKYWIDVKKEIDNI